MMRPVLRMIDQDNALFLELEKYNISFRKMMNDLAYRLPGLVMVNFDEASIRWLRRM